jgi:hypothetical protein
MSMGMLGELNGEGVKLSKTLDMEKKEGRWERTGDISSSFKQGIKLKQW